MAAIQKRAEHSISNFFKGTISAQLHFLGFIFAIIGMTVLLHFSSLHPDARHYWACLIYGVTSVMVFGASAAYHFLSDGFILSQSLYRWLKYIDHFAIYLFIAGTYTPFVMNAVAPPWRNIILFVVWFTAIVGILYTYFKKSLPRWAQHRMIYTGIFLVMGWSLVFRIGEVFQTVDRTGAFLLIAGGLSYTIGAVIYALKKPRLLVGIFGFHELWHIMVVAGFAFHYFLILRFYLPLPRLV